MPRLAPRLLRWYALNGRKLPWRGAKDPYRIWVSEIMLQQTRVDAVIPYYRRWLKRFPSLKSLAVASERDVLRLWEGLGYYARARNLQRAAKQVVDHQRGRLPTTAQELRQLPGIGAYTAAAIASIAYGRDEPVLDGNVRRVLARLFAVKTPIDSSAGTRALDKISWEILPRGRAGDFNQALMDLGATICVPFRPRCEICPVSSMCRALQRGAQDRLPRRTQKGPIPHRLLGAVAFTRKGEVLISRRPSSGLLGGMWEFPNAALEGPLRALPGQRLPRAFTKVMMQAYGLRLPNASRLGTIRHGYSHFRVTVQVYSCEARYQHSGPGLRWVRLANLRHYPMGRVDRQIADMIVG